MIYFNRKRLILFHSMLMFEYIKFDIKLIILILIKRVYNLTDKKLFSLKSNLAISKSSTINNLL